MAVSTYTVKRGDTLWAICTEYASSISGNTTNAKIDTVVKLNNIKNRDLIYVGQVLKFSGSTSSSTSSNASQATVSGFGLQSDDTSGRAMIVNWKWSKTDTAGYTVRWQQYLNGKWVGSDTDIAYPEDMYCQSTFSADKSATKVKFQVRPYYKKNDKITYWSDVKWSTAQEYDFSNNPPLAPDTPTAKLDELDGRKLVISINNIIAEDLDAKYIQFNIVKNNTSSIHTSSNVTINTSTNYVSYEYTVDYGADYKVRARSVSAKDKTSGWSAFCNNVGTKPCAPKEITTYRRNKRSDGSISAYLEWTAVSNATSYIVEYTTLRENFETGTENWDEKPTAGANTSIEITDIAVGSDYFFRVRAVNSNGESEPTDIVTIPIGEPPAAPTTWSSANSAFVGESMELNWTHNSRDGSAQTWAQLSLKINDGDWKSFTFENTTNSTTGEQTDTDTFTYGTVISYKGELHVKMDTSHADLKDAKIQWKVRTAGVTDAFSDIDWSVDRTIHIYEKPDLILSVTSDLAGQTLVETLTGLPFYIRGKVDLDSYKLQRPIGYHLRVVYTPASTSDFYETVDDAGRTKTVSSGDAVYSKYFDTDKEIEDEQSGTSTKGDLLVEMSAINIDLESGMTYTVYCTADMSTGLSVEQSYEFTVNWTDAEYTISATINVNEGDYTASIIPYCEDVDGNLVEDVTLSVYRREYDGTLTKISSGIPNNGTAIFDPHPALDYARYRLIAKDDHTGAISFYDIPGYHIGCTSVIVQWDEAWSQFETSEEYSVEAPAQSGSMLVLPYNVKISDNRKRDVTRVTYAGRQYPVSYHGSAISEGSSWSTVIPKNDAETIYALRRLSLWAGPVYIREPSGMGFWANVVPTFSIDGKSVTVPVTLDVTRVEGGV